ncbi:MAG: hypothetical protein AAGC55_08065 [Myxococcota bacterium]
MKKIKRPKKQLRLAKETLRRLDHHALNRVAGRTAGAESEQEVNGCIPTYDECTYWPFC